MTVLHNLVARARNPGSPGSQHKETVDRRTPDPRHLRREPRRPIRSVDQYVLEHLRILLFSDYWPRWRIQVDSAPRDQPQRCTTLFYPAVLWDGLRRQARGATDLLICV